MKGPTASQLLIRAADYMQQHGWCRKVNRTATGRVCVLGALAASVRGYCSYDDPAYTDARIRLSRHLKMSVPVWNDKICESKAQAVKALTDAAH